MKRILGLFLISIMVLYCAIAGAESSSGIWEERFYVDEFDLPTEDSYISNAHAIVGKFSNSATTDSKLHVFLFIDDGVAVRLIEYGDHIVKNSYSRIRYYDVAMMDTNGNKHYFTGMMHSGTDILTFGEKDSNAILSALSGNGTVRFAITEENNPTTKYSFIIEETAGLTTLLAVPMEHFTNVSSIADGLVAVLSGGNNKWGFVDTTGNLVIPCQWDYVHGFKDGLAPVCIMNDKQQQWGYINKEGTLVIPYQWSSATAFSEGLACVRNQQYGYIDKTGKVIIPYEWDYASSFSDGLAIVQKNGKYGFINTKGEVVIPLEYENARNFKNGCIPVQKNGKWGVIDVNGKQIVPYKYGNIMDFSDSYALVKKNRAWGFINEKGKEVIPCKERSFVCLDAFSEGYVSVAGGYMNASGKIVIKGDWNWRYGFHDGQAIVGYLSSGKYGIIDTKGATIIPIDYDNISYGEGWYALLKNGSLTFVPNTNYTPDTEKEKTATKNQDEEDTAFVSYETLKPGSKGQAVLDARMKLYELGYFNKKPTQTEYTNNMKDYVKKFEKDYGLKQDGILSSEDQEVLFGL